MFVPPTEPAVVPSPTPHAYDSPLQVLNDAGRTWDKAFGSCLPRHLLTLSSHLHPQSWGGGAQKRNHQCESQLVSQQRHQNYLHQQRHGVNHAALALDWAGKIPIREHLVQKLLHHHLLRQGKCQSRVLERLLHGSFL